MHDIKVSPACDIIHVETGMEWKVKYIGVDNVLDINLSLEVAPYFRIERKEGEIIIHEIKNVVSQWKLYIINYGIL